MKQEINMNNKLKEYLLITAGIILVVIGVYFFKFPNNFSIGGVTGAAMILSQLSNDSISSKPG